MEITIPTSVSNRLAPIERDGRIAWPSIVQYRMPNGEIRDVPPTNVSDPDRSPPPRFARMLRDGAGQPKSVPFELVIHDLALYEELARSNRLYCDAHAGGTATITDNRRAPSA